MLKKYRNIDKFDPSIYEQIDTNYLYQEIGTCYADRKVGNIRDFKKEERNVRIQFYPRGYLRLIAFSEKPEGPDPEVTGARGVIYKKGGKTKIDRQIADQDGTLQRGIFLVRVDGDRIYVMYAPVVTNYLFFDNSFECDVYQKAEKVPEDWKKYKPDW
ncbi:hypothetical protein [Sphingobacterium deserti]|nr:hypothetical protein [Sphingobacterium deserti]